MTIRKLQPSDFPLLLVAQTETIHSDFQLQRILYAKIVHARIEEHRIIELAPDGESLQVLELL